MTWENRVVGYDTVPPDQLLAHPGNFRRHPAAQREALRGSLNELGVIAPVLVNRMTGHLLDGHARVEEYLSAGLELVPVAYVEVDPEKESLALLSLDPIAAMAEADKEALDLLLHEAATSEQGLQEMMAGLAEEAGLYSDSQPSDGSLLELAKVAIADPVHAVQLGEVWKVGPHTLICADVIRGWGVWVPYLKGPEYVFVPYPGPFVPLSVKVVQDVRLVMMQPDPFIAGHIVDEYAALKGEGEVERVGQA